MAKLFTGKKSMFGVAVYMATSTSITTFTGPLATIVGQIATMRCYNILPEGEAMLGRMNDVLRGRHWQPVQGNTDNFQDDTSKGEKAGERGTRRCSGRDPAHEFIEGS